jgi:O-antigen ligase
MWRDVLPEDPLERMIFIFTGLCICFTSASIAVSQIFLTLALATWTFQRLKGKAAGIATPPLMLPIFAFILTTMVSVSFSSDLLVSAKPMKKFFLFLIILLVFNKVRKFSQITLIYKCVFVMMGAAALYAIVQYPSSDDLHRIRGFVGHWMTFAGLALIVFTALLAFILYYGREALWAAPLLIILTLAILLSLTRSVWLGVIFSATAMLACKKPRLALLAPALIILVLILSPARIVQRSKSIFDPSDAANRARIDMLYTGINMIKAHPLVGIGPNQVPVVAYDYGADRSIAPSYYVHLHNNVLQLAAERGLPCLAAWLWLIFKLFYDYYRMARRISFKDPRSYPLAVAIAALIAILIAGLFEYNFGDSEVLMLLLFVLTAPYVVDREGIADCRF